MLPEVIFVGPTKCGTTWIDAYLRTRAEVVLPEKTKETFFFDKVFERGAGWYEAQFPVRTGLCVEVAPSLFHKPAARAALAATLPEVRVVILLRDPWERAVSHYFHYRKAGEGACSIAEMAEKFPVLVEASLIFKHVQAWEAAFPGRVQYLSYDLLRADPERFCRDLCAVLGLAYVAPAPALSGRHVNAAAVPRHALAARLGRWAAEWARHLGAHGLVNRLRKTPLKAWLFSGGGNVEDERRRVRDEVRSLAAIATDHAQMQQFLAERGLAPPR